MHFLERFPEPQTVLGRVALKVLTHWRAFARESWPTAPDQLQAARSSGARASLKNKKVAETVGLATLWRMAMDLEKVWHGRSHKPEVNPEDIYEALGHLTQYVEIDCWTRDDETMLELFKKKHDGHGCSFCGLYSLDGHGDEADHGEATDDVTDGQAPPDEGAQRALQGLGLELHQHRPDGELEQPAL